MLCLCTWKDSGEAFLVDAKSESDARSIAKTEDEKGEAPDEVKALPPNFFAAWIRLADPEAGDPEELEGELLIDPLEHAETVLVSLAGFEDEEINQDAPCDAVGELDDGEVVTCTEPQDHEPPHRARVGNVVKAEWEDA